MHSRDSVGLLLPVEIELRRYRRVRDTCGQTGNDTLGKEAALTVKRAQQQDSRSLNLVVVIAIGSVLAAIAIPHDHQRS